MRPNAKYAIVFASGVALGFFYVPFGLVGALEGARPEKSEIPTGKSSTLAKTEAVAAAVDTASTGAIGKGLEYPTSQRLPAETGDNVLDGAGSGERAQAMQTQDAQTQAGNQLHVDGSVALVSAELNNNPSRGEKTLGEKEAPSDSNRAAEAPSAGGYRDGAAAYNRGDFAVARRLWSPLADKGDARAQLGLAMMYFLGQGVPRNMAAAMDWCHKAADQGLPAAQYRLGQMYANPWRAELQDFIEAAKWYEKAANQNYAAAQDELGAMYEFGLGTPRDFGKAEAWFVKAGDLLSVAKMYEDVDPRRAMVWRQRLARQGDRRGKLRPGETHGKGDDGDHIDARTRFDLAAPPSGNRSAP